MSKGLIQTPNIAAVNPHVSPLKYAQIAGDTEPLDLVILLYVFPLSLEPKRSRQVSLPL